MKRSNLLSLFIIFFVCISIVFSITYFFILSPPENTPNVILIVCDTLRPDHLGCYGYERDTSKNTDLFAEEAIIFKNAYAQAPATNPSMFNIVTSRYKTDKPVKDDIVTMAEFFKSRGYKTGAFIAQNHLLQRDSNLNQGFDIYNTGRGSRENLLTKRRATSVTNSTIEWIDKNKKSPFFVWAVYFDPHDPYIPPDKYKGYYNKTDNFSGDRRAEGIGYAGKNNNLVTPEHRQFLINAYDEEVRYFDFEFGRLISYLKQSELYDNSIIIFTSDHGEELGDNGGRWDHVQILSQEEIGVPLIIKMPGEKNAKVIDCIVQIVDIYPTLVEYLDGDNLPSSFSDLQGNSFLKILSGEENLSEGRFAVSFWNDQKCLVMDGYKYWFWKGKEYLIDTQTRQQVSNQIMLDKQQNRLDAIIKKYELNDLEYKKIIEDLRTLGYL